MADDGTRPPEVKPEPAGRLSRRTIFKAFGAAGVVSLTPSIADAQSSSPANAPTQPQPAHAYTFLNPSEVAFVEAAIDRLIPAEPEWAGALGAGVSIYIDRQLGGAFGQGARFYRSGPFAAGTPQQGYQLPHPPAELFRMGFQRLQAVLGEPGFTKLPPDAQDRLLKELETDKVDLAPIPAGRFFRLLLDLTMEGYFADPAHGGNRDMVSWRMVGFPGAHAAWGPAVEEHGVNLCGTPISMGQRAHSHDKSGRQGG